jgi:hypothetical protein
MNKTAKIVTGVLSAVALAGAIYYFTRKKNVVAAKPKVGEKFTADIKKRVEEAWKKSGSKLPMQKWWEEQNKKKGATLSADGKPDIFTIKGVGTADGQSVTGYKLPDNLNAVPVPVTLFFSPNLSPTVYEKGSDKKVDKKISKLIIVDRDLKLRGGSLISEEGYAVEFKPKSDLMVYQDADFNKQSQDNSGDDLGDFGGGSEGGGGGGFGSYDNGLVPMPVYGLPIIPPTPTPTENTNTNTITIGGRTFERPTTTQTIGVNPTVLGGGGGSGNVSNPPPIGVNPTVLGGGGGNVNTPPPIGRPTPRPRPRPIPAPPVGRPRPTPRPPMGRPIMPRPIGRRFDGGAENIDGSFEY